MKLDLDQKDIEAIAAAVGKRLRPVLRDQRRPSMGDTILSVQDLSAYLKVDKSWVYKQVQLGTIPYFKCGKYTRFKKSQIDRWIESETVKPVLSLSLVKGEG
jgi:excisionase family DNA binding protein